MGANFTVRKLWVNVHVFLFQVCSNGLITFGQRIPYYTGKPFPLSGSSDVVPIVAPFMSDVDLRHGGNVYSRISTDTALLDSVSFQGAEPIQSLTMKP